ncbi:MAG TPA: DUF3014 domain-containing protein [Steroidobacteraceae bacterium]|jgi:hypothetical protein|nr:DUF3014 domain-containing protein [Steroidobacteraceae bacterium]
MWEEETADSFRRKLIWWIGGLVLVAVIGFGIWYRFLFHPATTAVPPVAAQPPKPMIAEPAVSHPLVAGGGGNEALPALNDSDPVVQDALTAALGRPTIEALLVPQNIVRHIVVTIDNLPRKKLAVDLRPVKPTAGQTAVSPQGDLIVLSEANFDRYSTLVRAVQAADVSSLVAVYKRFYPLFQQSYEDLGYPGKYFNDRLVEVIDHLLETPEVAAPIQLEQPRVFYTFADPTLESRSAGQKLLIRMGPANARVIKAKLRELRAAIVTKN